MSIADKVKKINTLNLFLGFSITIFVISAIFGSISLFSKEKARTKPFLVASAIYSEKVEIPPQIFPVVASKNGKTYYVSSCGVAKRIKPENLVTFSSQHEAESRGYTPAKNCPELRELNDL